MDEKDGEGGMVESVARDTLVTNTNTNANAVARSQKLIFHLNTNIFLGEDP